MPAKVYIVKAMVFPLVMYGCENRTVKKGEHRILAAIPPSSTLLYLDSNGNQTNLHRRLLLGRKVMTNLDSILKSRDITLPTKIRLVKAMYG